MKYCSHCGKEVLDDAIICPGCGCSVQYGHTGNGGFTKSNNNGNNNYNNNNNSSYNNSYNNGNNNAQQQQQPYVPPYADSCSGLSIAGLIMSFFQPLIGLILSIVAHNEAKRTGSLKSTSMSKAGIIISSVFLGIAALIVIIYIIIICSIIISI